MRGSRANRLPRSVPGVPEFLVEFYMPRAESDEFAAAARRAENAACELAREGDGVACLRAIFVPEDETCFLLYRADSVAVVHEAVRRARLPLERLMTAILTADASRP